MSILNAIVREGPWLKGDEELLSAMRVHATAVSNLMPPGDPIRIAAEAKFGQAMRELMVTE